MNTYNIILTINFACIWPILGFMLGSFVLGWLLRKLMGGGTNSDILAKHQAELDIHANKYKTLEEKYQSLNMSYASASSANSDEAALKRELQALKIQLDAERSKAPVEKIVEKRVEIPVEKIVEKIVEKRVEVPAPKDYRVLSALFGKKIVADDLKLVEGIGPKIEELFHAAGYKTWASVAQADVNNLKKILEDAGERFKMHDPTTWPRQCQLMVDEEWADLKKYQEFLDGGVEPA